MSTTRARSRRAHRDEDEELDMSDDDIEVQLGHDESDSDGDEKPVKSKGGGMQGHKYPKTYYGGSNLDAFLRDFRRKTAFNSWSEEEQRKKLPCFLEGRALVKYNMWMENADIAKDIADIAGLLIKLKEEFDLTKFGVQQNKRRFQSCRQKAGESVEDFEARFLEAANVAGISDEEDCSANSLNKPDWVAFLQRLLLYKTKKS